MLNQTLILLDHKDQHHNVETNMSDEKIDIVDSLNKNDEKDRPFDSKRQCLPSKRLLENTHDVDFDKFMEILNGSEGKEKEKEKKPERKIQPFTPSPLFASYPPTNYMSVLKTIYTSNFTVTDAHVHVMMSKMNFNVLGHGVFHKDPEHAKSVDSVLGLYRQKMIFEESEIIGLKRNVDYASGVLILRPLIYNPLLDIIERYATYGFPDEKPDIEGCLKRKPVLTITESLKMSFGNGEEQRHTLSSTWFDDFHKIFYFVLNNRMTSLYIVCTDNPTDLLWTSRVKNFLNDSMAVFQ